MKHSYSEDEKVLSLLAPVDIAATATASQYINCANAVGTIEFDVAFGAVTGDSTGEVVVTIEASTSGTSNATEQAIAFRYRKSDAVATDSLGAITSATATGVTFATTDDNMMLQAYVEPAALAALGADISFLRVVATPTTDLSATLVGVTARYTSRYAGNSIPSST